MLLTDNKVHIESYTTMSGVIAVGKAEVQLCKQERLHLILCLIPAT
jgi:hypothetical protein